MLSHDQFRANVARVPHQGTDHHGEIIYGLVKWLRPFQCVEVGAWYGHTSCWIARALQENNAAKPLDVATEAIPARLLCIDDYSLWPEQNPVVQFWHSMGLCDVGEVVDVEKVNSRAAEWPERVDFAYIDGDHSLNGCKFDAEKAISLGAQCVVLHDTATWWGPRQYVEKYFPAGWTEVSVAFDQGLTIMMKKPEKPRECSFTEERFPEGHI